MKIYSLYYTHKPGGFCKRLYRLLNALALDDHEITYLSLDKPPATLSVKVTWLKIPFVLNTRSGFIFWALFSIWTTIFCFWVSLRKGFGARWVVFSPFYSALLTPSRLFTGMPLICFVRSKLAPASESELTAKVENLTQKICFKISDKIIVQTRANLELAIQNGCTVNKLFILPNSIDKISITHATRIPVSDLTVLCTGVFTRKKNLNFLISVWDKLIKISKEENVPCPELKIVGVIRDQDFSTNLPESIKLISWVDDLSSQYASSQIYLHPSIHEGMPNSVLEAMGNGLITLVADTPELKELVASHELIFSVLKPEELAIKIAELAKKSAKFEQLKQLCARRADELYFDWDSEAAYLSVN